MVKRFHVDNFRCLINFEVELDELNLFLGPNGSGKTSVLDALRRLQAVIARDARVDAVFPADDLSFSLNRDHQRFELSLETDAGPYEYALSIEHHADRQRMKIFEELLLHDGRPIYVFANGFAQLYHDDYTEGPKVPFDWSRSGVGGLNARRDNTRLTRFKQEIARFVIASPCPPVFAPETRGEDQYLDRLMENFVGWYRYAAQEDMRGIAKLFPALAEALPGFDSMNLTEAGENVRTLKVDFARDAEDGRRVDRHRFRQLSDGQKALVALYSLLFLSPRGRASLFLDEPDNYLALREVQPWFVALSESCGETLEQAVVVSHHPVTIDYLAGAKGRWFYRKGNGPARVARQPDSFNEGVTLSEAMVQGLDAK